MNYQKKYKYIIIINENVLGKVALCHLIMKSIAMLSSDLKVEQSISSNYWVIYDAALIHVLTNETQIMLSFSMTNNVIQLYVWI